MPNWAFGYVNVTGTRDGIKSFIERFVSEDDPSTISGKLLVCRVVRMVSIQLLDRWISSEFS